MNPAVNEIEGAIADTDLQISLYRQMVRIRMVEEAIARRYAEQEMRCPVHLSVGQEAVAAGVCAALRPNDLAVSTHRAHAHYLAKGGSLKAMMAEIYGKETGCSGGRGGSMHLFDLGAGMLASVPIVASSIPIGVGAALAITQKGGNQVVVVFHGDAAVEEGVFHESANFAKVKSLPVLFVCENNLYSVYTGLADRQPDRPLTDVAKAHAMSAYWEDGNDPAAVHAVAAAAAAAARDGGGPSFLVFDTYRWLEHCGPNFDNNIGYRSAAEFESWKRRCPVERQRRALTARGLWDDDQEARLNAEISAEVADAFAFAKQSPFPMHDRESEAVYA